MTDPATSVPIRPLPRRRYFPALDGLRFLAFLLIFSHHALPETIAGHPLLQSMARNAWCGVDLFFVLSGFLISYLLFVEEDKRQAETGVAAFSLPFFWVRRTLRIWPLYYLALALGFIVLPRLAGLDIGPHVGTAQYAEIGQRYGWSAPLFMMNWTSMHWGYPPSMMLAPLWSVCVEEQFYLLWPIILVFLKRAHRTKFIVGVIILSHLLKIPAYALAQDSPFAYMWIYLNPVLRADTLMTGALIAHFMVTHADRPPRVSLGHNGAFCGAIAVLCIMPQITTRSAPEMLTGYILLDIACAAGVILCLTRGSRLQRLLSVWPLPWLGRISYGLYVYHILAIAFADQATKALTGWPRTQSFYAARYPLALAICIAIGSVSYVVFERWFLRLKLRFTVVESRPGG